MNPVQVSSHTTPQQLVGRKVSHRFYDRQNKKYKWYEGLVIGYNKEDHEHEVVYENEEEHCHFNLLIDYATGDLKILE